MRSNDEVELQLGSEYADKLRKALNSSETKFKSYFKQFSQFYAIVNGNVWDNKLIPPQRDVDNIVNSILNTLKKNDIDIATVQYIPSEIRDEIRENAKTALEKPYKEAMIEQAKQDMSELIKYNKPIMWCEHIQLFDKEREYYYDGEVSMKSKSELEMVKDAFGEIYAYMNPMHAQEHFGYDRSHYGYIQDANIVDITNPSDYATAFITDKAIFVKCDDGLYLSTMINSYNAWLKEKGIEAPNIGGRDGYDALIDCYTQQLPEYKRQLSSPISEKYQFVMDLVKGMKDSCPYMLLHNNGRMSIDVQKRNGKEDSKFMSDINKGAVVSCDEIIPFVNMETGEKINPGVTFNVVDKIEIGDNTILVTDYAIISSRDITKELGMSIDKTQDLEEELEEELIEHEHE